VLLDRAGLAQFHRGFVRNARLVLGETLAFEEPRRPAIYHIPSCAGC
jgi:hypothetical protein